MLKNSTCITYNNPTHERFQQEFKRLYEKEFLYYNAYKLDWLKKTDFYKNNMQMFKYEKYAGYFLWKPFCITRAFKTFYSHNVLYCDSNIRFKDIKRFDEVFTHLMYNQGFFFIKHRNFINRDWTRRDAFILMNADEERYWNANQVWTSCMGFTNSQKSKEFLEEYLEYCRQPQIVAEVPNNYGENLYGFKEHRWEQSVVSILVEKYKIECIYDDCTIDIVNKVYDEELYAYKEQINRNPLKEIDSNE